MSFSHLKVLQVRQKEQALKKLSHQIKIFNQLVTKTKAADLKVELENRKFEKTLADLDALDNEAKRLKGAVKGTSHIFLTQEEKAYIDLGNLRYLKRLLLQDLDELIMKLKLARNFLNQAYNDDESRFNTNTARLLDDMLGSNVSKESEVILEKLISSESQSEMQQTHLNMLDLPSAIVFMLIVVVKAFREHGQKKISEN